MRRSSALLLFGLWLALPTQAQAEGGGSPASEAGAERVESASASAEEARSKAAPAVPRKSELRPLIAGAAKRHGVELALVNAVIAAESAYDPQAVSRAGAIGLMQVMPATAADYGVADAARLFDPKVNVETGIRHLRRLLSKYNNDYGRAIMAYNAGEGVVDRTNSYVTYAETLAYTEAVIRQYRRNGGTQPTEDALRKVKLLRGMKNSGKAQRLLAQYLDLSLPEMRVRHNRSIRLVDPGLNDEGPKSRPMIVLESRKGD